MERKLYRYYFNEPENIYVALSKVNGKELENKKQLDAKMINLSGSGVSIKTKLDLPIKNNIEVQVIIELLEEKHEVDAIIVRKTETRLSSLFEYGLQFQIDRTDEDKLVNLVRNLEILSVKE